MAPLSATLATVLSAAAGTAPFCFCTCRRIASGAPLRICWPSGMSMPLIRVCAVKGMNRAPSERPQVARQPRRRDSLPPSPPGLWNNSTMLLPSGVSSAAEARAASRPTSAAVKPSKGTNCVARRLPMVIVPVLSKSSVSTSPATSTALPLLAMMFARKARSMPAMPMAASRAPMVVGIRHTSSATSVGTSVPRLLTACAFESGHVLFDVHGHRPERRGDDEEDQREGGQHEGKGDFVGRPLADRPFDQGDHAVEERVPGARGDLHDDAVGKDARAAGHAGAVAAGLANHGGRFAGDRRFVDRGHAFDDLAVAGNHFAGDDLDHVARVQDGRNRRPPCRRRGRIRRAGVAARLPQGVGLGFAAGFGDRRGEIGEQQRRDQPEVQRQQIVARLPRSGSRTAWPPCRSNVSTVPTSTVNITGFFHWMSGRSMTSDCQNAALSSSGSNKPERRLWRRASFRSSRRWAVCGGSDRDVLDMMFSFPVCGSSIASAFIPYLTSKRKRAEVFRDRSQGGHRQEQQRPDQDDRSQQEEPEGQRVGPHGADGERRRLLACQAGRQGERGDDRDEAAQQHHQPVAMSQRPAVAAAGLGLSLAPQPVFSPPNSEPLLAEAELNS